MKRLALASIILSIFLIASCSERQLKTISPPTPTAKLRVFVQSVSGSPPTRGWILPYLQWEEELHFLIESHLEETGIYELCRRDEIPSILGFRTIAVPEWQKNNWGLVRKAGKALHADYGLIAERAFSMHDLYFNVFFVNVESGKEFSVSLRIQGTPGVRNDIQKMYYDARKMQWVAYREIFRKAKHDMLATAIRKGRGEDSAGLGSPLPIFQPSTVAPDDPISGGTGQTILDLKTALQKEEGKGKNAHRLAVYDFEAAEPFKVMALILSEALREEIHRQGQFTLVNRENLIAVLKEMELQQTGLIDEKEAVKAGEGLAANQIVMGRYGILGKTAMLQAKRIDLKTQRILALSSINCMRGGEEEFLKQMPKLAQKLTAGW
jgi:hypothetical protein